MEALDPGSRLPVIITRWLLCQKRAGRPNRVSLAQENCNYLRSFNLRVTATYRLLSDSWR